MLDRSAYRWTEQGLQEIAEVEHIEYDDLLHVDRQKEMAMKNITSFVSGGPCLNMLLWGERGAGKSSLIKMLIGEFAGWGLIAVEFNQERIEDIYNMYMVAREYPEKKFMIIFDDITFDETDNNYRRFKSILEGGLEKVPFNCMFVATSNKRHLVNEKAQTTDDVYDRDIINERVSLYGRFGLVLGFYPLKKDEFLQITEYYMKKFNVGFDEEWQRDAENYTLERGSRSGRIARDFAVTKLIYKSSSGS